MDKTLKGHRILSPGYGSLSYILTGPNAIFVSLRVFPKTDAAALVFQTSIPVSPHEKTCIHGVRPGKT